MYSIGGRVLRDYRDITTSRALRYIITCQKMDMANSFGRRSMKCALSIMLSGAALLATSSFASPPTGQPATPEAGTLAAWSTRVSAELDQKLPQPQMFPGQPSPSGVVVVKFGCSETGAPSDVAIVKSSGSRSLDWAAMQGIKRVGLHPLPDGMAHGQRFQAAILFANSPEEARTLLIGMRKEAERQNSWFATRPQQTAAIAIMPISGNP